MKLIKVYNRSVRHRGSKASAEQHTALFFLGNRSLSQIGLTWKDGWLQEFNSSLTILNVTQELGRWLSTSSVCGPSLCAGTRAWFLALYGNTSLSQGRVPVQGSQRLEDPWTQWPAHLEKSERDCILKTKVDDSEDDPEVDLWPSHVPSTNVYLYRHSPLYLEWKESKVHPTQLFRSVSFIQGKSVTVIISD